MTDDARDPDRRGRPVRGAGARSRELPDVAVPSDPSIDRDIAEDPPYSEARRPGGGARPPEAYRTGGPEGTRPVEPGTGAPIGADELDPDAGEPPHEDAGGRRGGPGAPAPREPRQVPPERPISEWASEGDDDAPGLDQPPG
jgi:hypothetical protein